MPSGRGGVHTINRLRPPSLRAPHGERGLIRHLWRPPAGLPPELLSWALAATAQTPFQAQDSFVLQHSGAQYSALISPCEHSGEYLLMLGKRSGDWDIDGVRGSLRLTFKETEVLMWIARGKTNRDIGLILNCSPRTVNKHLEHVFEKLGVETGSAAVAAVMQRLGDGA